LPDQTEHDLLERARAGNRDAFAALQAALEGPARRFVRRLIGPSDADLERLDTGDKLRPFLFRVLRNQCYDELRAQGRYEAVSFEDESADVETTALTVAPQPGPDETAHWLLLYGEVQAAIDRLPESQRQVLLLYTVAGLSYAEIAEAMGTRIGTVKSRLHYAKQNLISRLHPETLAALDVAYAGEGRNDES
jgi:RNA polymerase sigma-70 factor (ECF subfamily)